MPKGCPKGRDPVARARLALAQRVRAPIRRLDALALTLRQRDLTAEETRLMAIAAEQVRAAARALRGAAP